MKVIWAERALNNFDVIIDYIKREWGINITVRFIDQTDGCIEKIIAYPEIGSFDERLACRKLLVVKQRE